MLGKVWQLLALSYLLWWCNSLATLEGITTKKSNRVRLKVKLAIHHS